MWKLTDEVLHGYLVRAGDVNVQNGRSAHDQIFRVLVGKEVNRGQGLAFTPRQIDTDKRLTDNHSGSELGIRARDGLFFGAGEVQPFTINDSISGYHGSTPFNYRSVWLGLCLYRDKQPNRKNPRATTFFHSQAFVEM